MLQSLSGTGSLCVGAHFIAKFLPGTKVYVSNPTWCETPNQNGKKPFLVALCADAERTSELHARKVVARRAERTCVSRPSRVG